MTFTTRPTLEGTFGMVSSTHWLASQSAQRMLELGGNAFDAAAAGGFVLHVVEPHLNGPGGDLPAIIATADGPDARACSAARARHRRERRPRRSPRWASTTCPARARWPRPSPVRSTPGCSCCATTARSRWRPCSSRRSATPATVIRCSPGWPRRSTGCRTLFRDELDDLGRPVAARRTGPARRRAVRQPGLRGGARAARRRSRGRRHRRGRAGAGGPRRLGRRASSPRRSRRSAARPGGTPAARCCPGWSAATTWRRSPPPGRSPSPREWHGVQVAKTDLWGQGPALLQVLAMLDVLGPQALDPSTADGIHAIAECWKLAMADREAWFGDRSPVSVDDLLAADYVAERAALVGAVADLGVRPGAPGGREPRLAEHVQRLLAGEATGRAADVTTGEPTVQRDGTVSGDTCHIDVVDRWGNIISATPSGGWLQSSPDHPRAGLLPGQPGADVLARRGTAVLAGARRPPAYDAHPDPRPARRRAGPRLRITGRRPAGPVAVAVPAAPRRRRDGASRRRSTPRCSTAPASRARSTRARWSPACSSSRTASPTTCSSRSQQRGHVVDVRGTVGRSAGCVP